MAVADALADLWEAESRLAELSSELSSAQSRQLGDARLAELEQRCGELASALRQRVVELRQMELEVAGLRERARSHERAIYDGSVRHPADLQRRQHELNTLRQTIDLREEKELAEMEDQEGLSEELAAAQRALAARAEEVSRQLEMDKLRAPRLAEEVGAAKEEVERLRQDLPESALRLYQRVASRRQPPVARVQAGTCSGCRLPLPHRLLEEARHSQLLTCENCERILVL